VYLFYYITPILKIQQKGAIPIPKRTISSRISNKYYLLHNSSEFLCENVDPTRTKDNIEQVYQELFDKAIAEYNAKQKRRDRIIKNYYEVIFQIDN